jgi:hypothetical protein
MTNRIGQYFVRGNDCAADVDRAVTALEFCESITSIYDQGGSYASDVEDALCRIEGEAMRVFYHHGITPPVPLASVLDRLLPWIIMAAFVVAVTAGVIMGQLAA